MYTPPPPPPSSKNEMLIFGLHSTSDDQSSDLSDKIWPKCEEGALRHQNMKCSFVDYIQLLIGQVIWAMKVYWNAKKGPLSHQKMKCSFFGLHSTSDDQLSNPSDKSWPKCKDPQSHQIMKCSFLDYIQLLIIGQVIQVTKVDQNANKGPLSHQNMKCLFFDYVKLLMISWAIRATKVNQNAKKPPPPKSSKYEMLIFGLCSTSDDWPSNLSEESWLNVKKAP